MLTVYSELHKLQHGRNEMMAGQLVPVFEMPRRAEIILSRVREVKLGEVIEPKDFGLEPLLRVHKPNYARFLQTAWDEWSKLGRTHDALPYAWPVRRMSQEREPQQIDARLGFFSFDAASPITPGTWKAVTSSANVALTAAERVREGLRTAFALCRPPGHHAAQDYMGGYCFLNNAAIAAQYFRDKGAERVAILDVDYHHGNGTQAIFYDRADVMLVNLHGDPRVEYPYFLGYADERGAGAGEGYNLNYPMPWGTEFAAWMEGLEDACKHIGSYAPDVLVVSLGVDTYKGDPISQFKLDSADYLRVGERIARLGLPTLFVMEGGYAVEEIGLNAVNVLQGFEGAA
jgi:acetoin utilization deacetylase AcuC-like enzyme